jgi:glyoxylase-like metal-dependent hydrolase (beta-lactamase superfamily II)
MMAASSVPIIHTLFEPTSGTWQYVVACPTTSQAAVIDPVLNFNAATNELSTKSADEILALVKEKGYLVTHLLETHVHADHLTASNYLQKQLENSTGKRPQTCIGKRIKDAQARFGGRYGIPAAELDTAFDHLCEDGETFSLGDMQGEVLYLPGHTPDHVGYMIGENVFAGDSIFNPDVGSARCDFPGGSATALYGSMAKLLSLPRHYRLYTGHDYPPATRNGIPLPYTTVGDQREGNKHVKDGRSENDFVKWRSERDAGLAEPKLINQALQFNIMAGRLPEVAADGHRYFVPKQAPQTVL